MQLKETNKRLNAFGKYVVSQSRTNLTKSKKNFSKRLYNSISYTIDETSSGSRLYIEMEDYEFWIQCRK